MPQDQLLLRQTPGSFRAVLGAKVSGLLRLGGPPLRLAPAASVLLFSSVSSIVAPLGQPNYAAANAMLNAWASARGAQARNQPHYVHLSPYSAIPELYIAVFGGLRAQGSTQQHLLELRLHSCPASVPATLITINFKFKSFLHA